MLRFLVLLLLLANGAYFAWSHDWLRAYGWAPERQTEPQRLKQQLQPEAIRVLSPEQARQIEKQSQRRAQPQSCVQAGPFDAQQAQALRRTLEGALPGAGWRLEESMPPGRWLVYMGKYPHADMVARKRAELALLGIKPQALGNPGLEPGLSLGAFETQAEAQAELQVLSRRGVRTARVLQEPVLPQHWLRIPAGDEALSRRLDELRRSMTDKPWQPCP